MGLCHQLQTVPGGEPSLRGSHQGWALEQLGEVFISGRFWQILPCISLFQAEGVWEGGSFLVVGACWPRAAQLCWVPVSAPNTPCQSAVIAVRAVAYSPFWCYLIMCANCSAGCICRHIHAHLEMKGTLRFVMWQQEEVMRGNDVN